MTTPVVGTIMGTIRINARQAIAEYAAVRRANESTRVALTSASTAFIRTGVAALAAAAPIALLFKSAVSGAADFQKKIDYFGAVTGASQKDMRAVAAEAIHMSRTTVYSASDMADAMVEFGKAGIKTQAIIGGVAKATANLAQAADISVGEAANIMASQLATFNFKASQASHVANILAGSANASIIDIQDLAYSLKYAGGIAATTGISFHSLVDAITLLGNRGIRGSTAGTSLRQIIVSLIQPTKAAWEELHTLGLMTTNGGNAFVDAAGHVKQLSQVFQLLQKAEAGMTDAQQLAANKTIFNSRALSAAQILMKQGAAGFVKARKDIDNVTASDVARKRLDNLAGDWRRFINNLKTDLIQVGGPLQNFFRGIVQGLTSLVKWFGNLSPHMQKMIIYGLGIVGMLLAFTGILSLTIGLVIKFIVAWMRIIEAFRLIGGLIRSVIVGIRMLSVALLTSPWFWVAAAIAAVVVALIYCWTHFKGFRDFVKQAWADIKQWTADVWNFIKTAFNDIVNFFKGVGRDFMAWLVDPIRAGITAVINFFKAMYRDISGAITSIINFVREHWKAILAIILPGLGLVIDAIVTHWDAIVHFFQAVWKVISDTFSTAINAIVSGLEAAWNGIVTFFTTIWNMITSSIRAVWNGIVGIFRAVWGVTFAIFRAAAHTIETVLSALWSVIGGPLKAFWNGIVKFFTTLWNDITSIFSTAWSTMSHTVGNVVSTIGSVLANFGTAIWNAIAKGASTIARAGMQVFHWITDPLLHLYEWSIQIGKNLVTGLWNGIVKLASWLWNQISGWISDIWHGILNFFGIHSPSTLMADIGKHIVLGLALGIESFGGRAINAVVRISERISQEFQRGADSARKAVLTLGYQLGNEIKQVTDNLKNLRTAAANTREGVKSSVLQFGDVSSLGERTNKKGKTRVTTHSVLTDFGTRAVQSIRFMRDLKKLIEKGYDQSIVDEMAQAGPSALPQIEALLNASKKNVAYANQAEEDIQKAANRSAHIDAKNMYKAGIDAARGLLKGLESEKGSLIAVARLLGSSIVKELKKELKISSPSRVMQDDIAHNMVRGLALGIQRNQKLAIDAVSAMNEAMMSHQALLTPKFASGVYASNRASYDWARAGTTHIGTQGGVHLHGNIHNHNPKPETASNSVPRSIRKLSYLGVGPRR